MRVLLLLVLVPSVAHAGHAAVAVDGGLAVISPPAARTPLALGGLVGASIAWERGAPAWPDDGSVLVTGEVAPEVAVMQLADRTSALAGVRLAIHVAGPRRQGGHARLSVLLTPRVGAITGGEGVAIGGDLEIAYWIGRSAWRVGWRQGFLTWNDAPMLRSTLGGTRELAAYAGLAISR